MTKILQDHHIRLEALTDQETYQEKIYLTSGGSETLVLESFPHVTALQDERLYAVYYQEAEVVEEATVENGILRVRIEHPDYTRIREISLTDCMQTGGTVMKDSCPHTLHFRVTTTAKKKLNFRAIEDKWDYKITKREADTPLDGPLDFVWSQRIKTIPMDIVSHYNFRTPVVMFQQGSVFAGLIAGLEGVTAQDLDRLPLGMDLNVTENTHPWFSFGGIGIKGVDPDQPCEAGHTHIVRGSDRAFVQIHLNEGESCSYCYSLLVKESPERLGYRDALRYLWQRYHTYRENTCHDLYENVRFPGVFTLQQWEKEIWDKQTRADFYTYEKDGKTVGAVTGRRQGEWFSRTDYKHDAWFACWLQELVTGYGMYRYGRKNNDPEWLLRAEQILDLILSAPRTKGMFPVICYLEEDGNETWLRDDGWAGYYKEFHTLQMSYTAWLLTLWAQRVFPERKTDILELCIPYAEFLTGVQHKDGCIPSWFNTEGEPSRLQFRDFNAETAASAIFLLELGELTGRKDFVESGMLAIDFIETQVRPRQRWYDLETFLSCAKKSFAFYDGITAQYPQCNLSQIFAAFAYLKRYRMTRKPEHLVGAEEVLDYLLLTQQIWNHPGIRIDTFGGFTVQNTDNEWNDAREALCAILLYEAYMDTGRWEYLERSVAAMHGGFQNLPYENWAHCGYEGMQYDSSLLWGGGIILTAAEYLEARLGLINVDVKEKKALGLWGIQVTQMQIDGNEIRLQAQIPDRLKQTPLCVQVYGAPASAHSISVNGSSVSVRETNGI